MSKLPISGRARYARPAWFSDPMRRLRYSQQRPRASKYWQRAVFFGVGPRKRSIFADPAAVREGRRRRRMDVRFQRAGYEKLFSGVWCDPSTDAAYSLLGGQLDYVSPA